MGNAVRSGKSKVAPKHKIQALEIPAWIEQLSNLVELRLMIKVGVCLWILLGITALVDWIRDKNPPSMLSQSAGNKITPVEFQPMQLLGQSKSTWRPGSQSSGECGALQDSNMRRFSGDIQQMVNNAPAGYETPYRVQKY